jgi:beta-lactamase class A
MSILVLAVSALLAAPSPAPAKEDVLWDQLRERVAGIERGLEGVLGLSVKDLTTGRTLEVRPQEPFPQASSIKLAVLYELYRQAEDGSLALDEVTQPPLPRVGGDGMLQHLSGQVRLTWRDLAVLMMAASDNEAANRVIERVGMDAVNRRLDGLGLPHTRLRRRMMDLAAARRGEENVSTPAEMRRLMEALRAGTGLGPERTQDLLAVAGVPRTSYFSAALPDGVRAVYKTGELDGVRCATAFVDVPGRPYVAAITTTYLRRDADGEAAVRDISAALYSTFDRLARSSDLGRVIR